MENKEKNMSIIDQAIADLKKINETADKNALEKMKKALPEKFENFLKEELNKLKKESVNENESVKDKVTKEPVREGKKTDNNKESLNEMEEIDLRELSIDDIEEAYDEASSNDEFEVSSEFDNEEEIDINDVEQELSRLEDMNSQIEELHEIGDENDPYKEKLKTLHKMIGEMINSEKMSDDDHNYEGEEEMEFEIEIPDEDSMNEGDLIKEDINPVLLDTLGAIFASLAAAGGIAPYIKELMKKDPKIADSIRRSEELKKEISKYEKNNVREMDSEMNHEMDETAGSQKGHAINRTVGNERMPKSTPRKDSTQREYQRQRVSEMTNESIKKFNAQKRNMEKRMLSLINENKKITKKLNESKAKNKQVEKLLKEQDEFKKTLVKYRNQLSEMAIFNTNIAGVNSILLNENLALTNDDKKDIVNRFKNAKSVTESENIYKKVLSEMSDSRKKLDENIEDKVTNSIDKSSSEKVVEQTAYVNEHVNKIKNLMRYVDNHGNSKKVL